MTVFTPTTPFVNGTVTAADLNTKILGLITELQKSQEQTIGSIGLYGGSTIGSSNPQAVKQGDFVDLEGVVGRSPALDTTTQVMIIQVQPVNMRPVALRRFYCYASGDKICAIEVRPDGNVLAKLAAGQSGTAAAVDLAGIRYRVS